MEDFPIDLVRNIGKRLNTKIDVSQFRAVCKSWRSSIPAYKTKPPIRACFYPKCEKVVLNLVESVVYGLVKPPVTSDSNIPSSGSCSWFIVKVPEVESNQENRVLRLHPLSRSSLRPPRALNLLDFRVLELGKSLVDLDEPSVRAAISSKPDWPALMVVADGQLHYSSQIGTENCTLEEYLLLLPKMPSLMDVVFYKGEFYVVAVDGTTIAIDSCLRMRSVASYVGREWKFVTTMYLVESLGELLLVRKSTPQGPIPRLFCVYKLNTAKKQWVRMRSLNNGSLTNRILFVGHFDDGCFAAPAQDFPGCDGNRIYFSHKSLLSGKKTKGAIRYVEASDLPHNLDESEEDDSVSIWPDVSYEYID